MQPQLSAIYFYPVKGFPGISLDHCEVLAGERLPMDRRFAIGPKGVDFDPAEPRHVPKRELFVQLQHEQLAELSISFDTSNCRLSVSHKGETKVDACLENSSEAAELESFISEFLGKPAQLLAAPGHGFTDLSHRTVSIINLASIRDLESTLGYEIDKRRFRANFYIDGLPAWSELEWMDKTISINGTEMEIYRITDRCAAINVNPVSAQRDTLLNQLKKARGNIDMGVYARVLNNGRLAVNDLLTLPI